jgi:hypothetical protein
MARLDLTDEEHTELIDALCGIIESDRFPLSPRIRRLKAILAKLVLPKASPETFPPPKPPAGPSLVLRRRR